jgi:hypothetical protein
MKRTILAALALASLSGGCVSTTDAERRAIDETRCRSYGFRSATDGMARCLLEIDLDRAAERRFRMDTAFGGTPWFYGRRW